MTIEKIRDNFDKIPYCGCWLWRNATTKGYGIVQFNGKVQYTHRIMYEDAYGPIPEGGNIITEDALSRMCKNTSESIR